jgi:hypothetical protein
VGSNPTPSAADTIYPGKFWVFSENENSALLEIAGNDQVSRLQVGEIPAGPQISFRRHLAIKEIREQLLNKFASTSKDNHYFYRDASHASATGGHSWIATYLAAINGPVPADDR